MSLLNWYKALLQLYPKAFRDRFGESLIQTFRDLDTERRQAGRSPLGFVPWMFLETSTSIIKENAIMLSIDKAHVQKAAVLSGLVLMLPLALTLANPSARLRGGDGGGFDWMPGSFLIMGAMLFAVGMGVQMVAQRIPTGAARFIAIGSILLLFAAVWIELAVDGVSQIAMFLG